MIVPMVKYEFLLYRNDLEGFLNRLQDLGVVHIESRNVSLDASASNMLKSVERYEAVGKALRAISVDDAAEACEATTEQLIAMYETAVNRRSDLDVLIKKTEHDIDEALPWGEFNPHDVERLKQLGFIPRFYSVAEKHFHDDWTQSYALHEINRHGGQVYFVLLQEPEVELDFELQEAKLPAAPYPALLEELKRLNAEDEKYRRQLACLALSADKLDEECRRIRAQIDFRIAGLSAADAAEGSVKVLTVWTPEAQSNALESFLNTQHAVWFAERKPKDAEPPVLLKNNRYAKLFEPITKLYSLPGYRELDLTPMLAPFFMLFFGFCLGDGGYGLLILVLTSLLKLKIKDSNVRPFLSLGQWLGGATMLFGFITSTFFGVTFNDIKLDRIAEEYFGLPENYGMLILALIFGAVQITFGMCVNVANIVIQRGWRYALSSIAWIFIILGGAVYYLAGEQMSVTALYALYAVLALSALTAFFYNSPGKNPLLNVGSGIWTAYNTISGLVGDLLSYIRLFALGMTGGILGSVFNAIALDAGKGVGIPVLDVLITLLILVFGHGLNIALNMLGAFVHPMRLTFVEFYKNAGFAGGGQAFKAFKAFK